MIPFEAIFLFIIIAVLSIGITLTWIILGYKYEKLILNEYNKKGG